MSILSAAFDSIQRWLIPDMEEEVGELTEKMREFVRVVEILDLPKFMAPFDWCGAGCPPCGRMSIFKAFILKAVCDYPTTKAMIEAVKLSPPLRRLCGWETLGEIPSESTFSRAFAQFAKTGLPNAIHAAAVAEKIGKDKIAGHVSRDSTAIEAREKAPPKAEAKTAPAANVATPNATPGGKTLKAKEEGGAGTQDAPPAPVEETRLERQKTKSSSENFAELPTSCDWGAKKGSKGNKISWKGYKLHIDTIDGDIPVNAFLSSASLHDSQAAIPLIQSTSERITYLYDLMDSAYDAAAIHEVSRLNNHVPVIDHNQRRGDKREFDPAKKERYKERSAAERVNSDLKDNHGGRHVRVKGPAKVFAHLMFGLLVVAVSNMHTMLS